MKIQGNIRRGGAVTQKAVLPRRVAGFSLIEMLVVIAVIGILAALLLGALPAISDKKIRSAVRAELRMLVTEIEAYKAKHGFYPPDNTNNIAQAPLFYELVGTTVASNPDGSNARYLPLNGAPELTQQDVRDDFSTDGFLNTGPDRAEVKSFLPKLKTNAQYIVSPFSSSGKGIVLRVPAKGPKNATVPAAEELNAWKYIVAKGNTSGLYPTNNPNTFDLWADVVIRGKTVTIGNWKEQ